MNIQAWSFVRLVDNRKLLPRRPEVADRSRRYLLETYSHCNQESNSDYDYTGFADFLIRVRETGAAHFRCDINTALRALVLVYWVDFISAHEIGVEPINVNGSFDEIAESLEARFFYF